MTRGNRDAPAAVGRLPNFVIIGAQKAGTTTLEGWLSRHPDVWMPETEDAFFRDPVYRQRSLEQFAEQYAGRSARMLGLKCPDYLARPEVARRLATDLGLPLLLVSLRNPIHRAVSGYFWNMRWGIIPIAPLNEGLRAILDEPAAEANPQRQEVLDWGLYAKHLTRYLEFFPADRIHVLLDEDLRNNPDDAWHRTARFLALDPNALHPGVTKRSRNEGIYSLARVRFLQARRPAVLHWDRESGYATIPKSQNPVVRGFSSLVAGTDRYLLRPLFDNTPPELEPDVEARLRDYYRSDLHQLQRLIGRDLTGWLR